MNGVSRETSGVQVSPGSPGSRFSRIQLVWPDKGCVPLRLPDGGWQLVQPDGRRLQYPLIPVRRVGESTDGRPSSLLLEGERLHVLSTLRRIAPGQVRLAYVDLPRIVIDDKTRAFQGDTDRTWSTYLSVVREHLRALVPLMSRQGVVIVHPGDAEDPYVRLVATEIFGRQNCVGTIVWQRHYAPRNMRGMKEFTATHDPISVFAVDKDLLPSVALAREPRGYENPDDDPRGPWKAEHKGARTRRENSDFETNLPPYRWRLVHGRLPPGVWRVSPFAGVIWGVPREAGRFGFTVEVADEKGQTATARLQIVVKKDGEPELPQRVPWLFADGVAGSGPLQIVKNRLPPAVCDCEYWAVLEACGGAPYTGKKRPRSGRYWEFANYTLEKEVLRDNVEFGHDGTAIPHPKRRPPPGGAEFVNLQTWWPARAGKAAEAGDSDEGESLVGYTEDATKHLKKMVEMGLLHESVTTSKPEPLLERLVRVFSRPGDTVLELFGEAADLSSVAIKTRRRFIYLAGSSTLESRLLEGCARPRLEAIVAGNDRALEEGGGEIRLRKDAYIPYEGGGAFDCYRLGEYLVEFRPDEEYPLLNPSWVAGDFGELRRAILTAEGFLPTREEGAAVDGVAFDGRAGAVVLGLGEFLTQAAVAGICSRGERYERLIVYYFRSADDFDPERVSRNVVFKRVPMDLSP